MVLFLPEIPFSLGFFRTFHEFTVSLSSRPLFLLSFPPPPRHTVERLSLARPPHPFPFLPPPPWPRTLRAHMHAHTHIGMLPGVCRRVSPYSALSISLARSVFCSFGLTPFSAAPALRRALLLPHPAPLFPHLGFEPVVPVHGAPTASVVANRFADVSTGVSPYATLPIVGPLPAMRYVSSRPVVREAVVHPPLSCDHYFIALIFSRTPVLPLIHSPPLPPRALSCTQRRASPSRAMQADH